MPKGMWKGRFSQETAKSVVEFSQSLDLDWRMAFADIRGSIAHVRMLAHIGILTDKEAKKIEKNLIVIAKEIKSGKFEPKISLEDVHMNIEARLTELCGATGAKLHTGRSRNDQVNTTVRLFLRREILELWEGLYSLIAVLIEKADEHIDCIVPGYTHLQQAQPISMGHFWMAYAQAFLRDAKRLFDAYAQVDECTLGSGAIAGSTLPLDRKFTAEDLGFAKVSANSMDSVAQRDHFLDLLHFAAVFGQHASRLSEDLIIYFSSEFSWVKLPDAFCTGSSMMPQKKNPDVLELIRGKAGVLAGAYTQLMTLMKGIPSTYDRDLQEDKRPLFDAITTLKGIFSVLPALIKEVEIKEAAAKQGFEDGLILATDVAEYLVVQGIPFREAHEKVGKTVAWCIKKGRPLTKLTLKEWQKLIPEVQEDLLPLLEPEVSVGRRLTLGGTAPLRVKEQINNAACELVQFANQAAALSKKLPEF